MFSRKFQLSCRIKLASIDVLKITTHSFSIKRGKLHLKESQLVGRKLWRKNFMGRILEDWIEVSLWGHKP